MGVRVSLAQHHEAHGVGRVVRPMKGDEALAHTHLVRVRVRVRVWVWVRVRVRLSRTLT